MSDSPFGCVFEYCPSIEAASHVLIFTWVEHEAEPYACPGVALARGDGDGIWRVALLRNGADPYIHKMFNRRDAEDSFERIVAMILSRAPNLHVPHSAGVCKNGWLP